MINTFKLNENIKLHFVLHLADNALILGHRLSEWCGHGPILEQDIALTNIALDHIGLARNLYQYAAELYEDEVTEDYFPYQRDIRQFYNALLVEQENEDFAYTIIRSFFYDCYQYERLQLLTECNDERLREIAEKSLKETSYHRRFSAEWVIRLGDGTAVSKEKMTDAIDDHAIYLGEMWTDTNMDIEADKLLQCGLASATRADAEEYMKQVLTRATLEYPTDVVPRLGGKEGKHTEKMGFILSDLQYMQKTYPNQVW